jgi:glycine oxidase
VAPPADIIVVGAGIIGCAVGYELARRGASVQIVDDRPAGMGATQASAGVLAPYIEARHGGPLLELTTRSLDMFEAFAAGVAADSGLPVAFHRTGTLDVALQPESLRQFCATASLLTHDAMGGLLLRMHAFVAAGELTRALVAGASRHGARLIEGERVHAISRSDRDLAVHTSRRALVGNGVVIAAGSWAGQIAIEGTTARVPVKPIRGQLLQLGWSGSPLRRVTWGERCYIVPWQDGTVLVGATVEDAGFDERTTLAGVRDLIEAACELVPQSWTASLKAAKVGLRPGTPDDLPIIGRSSVLPTLVYATGHYRNGVLLSPLTAKLVADAVLDDVVDPMLEWTSPRRFGSL